MEGSFTNPRYQETLLYIRFSYYFYFNFFFYHQEKCWFDSIIDDKIAFHCQKGTSNPAVLLDQWIRCSVRSQNEKILAFYRGQTDEKGIRRYR